MLVINETIKHFYFTELKAKGKCAVCSNDIPKGTKTIRIVGPKYIKISICPDCLTVLSDIANDKNNYGYTEEELRNGFPNKE